MFLGIFIKVISLMIRGKKLVLATHNIHKKEEMINLLGNMGITVFGLDDFSQVGEINETGKTLFENSLIKAQTVHGITGLPSLADDTGLEVDVLEGAPGIYSARYAGLDCSSEDNVNKLLFDLKGVTATKRKACFRTVMTFVNKSKELKSEGMIKGMITMAPKGSGGFGYDSIFQPENYSCTFAQLELEEKNRISHRSIALVKMLKKLESFYE